VQLLIKQVVPVTARTMIFSWVLSYGRSAATAFTRHGLMRMNCHHSASASGERESHRRENEKLFHDGLPSGIGQQLPLPQSATAVCG
jgi:hypothetical protein